MASIKLEQKSPVQGRVESEKFEVEMAYQEISKRVGPVLISGKSHSMVPSNQRLFDQITKLIEDIHNILDINLLARENKKSIIWKNIESMLSKKKGEDKDITLEFGRLRFLVMQLEVIKNKNFEIFRRLRKDLRQRGHSANWYGVRAEILFATPLVSILQKKCYKSESPDFIAEYQGVRLFFEVSCPHMPKSKAQQRNVLYKITSSIRAKAEKKYANKKTALVLDITNIMYNHGSMDAASVENVFRYIEDFLEHNQIQYGGVWLLVLLFERSSLRFSLNQYFFPLAGIDEKLLRLVREMSGPDSVGWPSNIPEVLVRS